MITGAPFLTGLLSFSLLQAGPVSLPAERLRPSDGDSESRQFLAADKKGRIHVLRESPLSVQRLGAGDKLGLADRITVATVDPAEDIFLSSVSLDLSGDAWMFSSGPLEVRWVVLGKEKVLPPVDYPVSAVALVGGVPVIAVVPRAASPRVEARFPGELPFLLEYAEGRWRPLATEWISAEESVENLRNSHHWTRRLAIGPENRIWVAHQARYIVEWLSSSGKRLLKVRVGDGVVRQRPATDAEREATTQQFGTEVAARIGGNRTVYVTKAIAAGRDGRLYLLIDRPEGGYAVDRLDPLERKLERVVLEDLEGSGFTMVAGSDGLYVGTIASGEGRWRIGWEALEAAKWSAVPDTRFDTPK